MKALVELDQLERGARPIAEPVRLGDIGIVELPRQPFGRGRFAPARPLDADREGPNSRPAARSGGTLMVIGGHKHVALSTRTGERGEGQKQRQTTQAW